MSNLCALVLAGGQGKRMGVLCESKPKPALPFAGNHRVIDFSLSNCLNSQIENIGVLTGYQRSYLRSYLQRWQNDAPGAKKIVALDPKSGAYAGTADAVYQNLKFPVEQSADLVLILAADHVY